jgi:alanyl-tRNA synthetase
MNKKKMTANEIRNSFIDFFKNNADHTFVRSSSLVPGEDSTLLFTNAGMVQFKDVFLGLEKKPYTRAVNFQKCLRVAGKHNDLEDVGQDDTHHTFFEMLGNWSFGDYYKKEAITWAWELLTEIWEIPKGNLYTTVFKDEKNEIPTDEDAASLWRLQPGFNPNHIFYLGRKDNFWEMADTGPCGPCSEIHIDLRPGEGSVTAETLDTDRFTELWNLVFIQYNRTGPDKLIPLPSTHVDTGLGFERIVNILQGSGTNYRTDLFWPLIEETANLTGHSEEEISRHFTAYRVIADHARAAAFLIADGVVPGNMGRNYVCRMIIRRAFRFGEKIGLQEPFLSSIAEVVINNYGKAYPELIQNQHIILNTILREEEQFEKTLERATSHLDTLLDQMIKSGETMLRGEKAAYLYTTYGLPLEIARDIAKERGMTVDQDGFEKSMEEHRLASGAGKSMGEVGGEEVTLYRQILISLQSEGKLKSEGVHYNPYGSMGELSFKGEILALIKDAQTIEVASPGDTIDIVLPSTKFFVESGGQVADHGLFRADDLEIEITNVRTPAAGIITHYGTVKKGYPRVGDQITAIVDTERRKNIMRNHTATHLLHSALKDVLGNHARQAGSLVAPDRLRFDFTHHESLSNHDLKELEDAVNKKILENYPLKIAYKSLDEALQEGAIALFGEKYGEEVRNITIGEGQIFSNELCGGTHVENTGEIGTFIIISESSVASGIRRIEAITGRASYQFMKKRFSTLEEISEILATSPDGAAEKIRQIVFSNKELRNQIDQLRKEIAVNDFNNLLGETIDIQGIKLLIARMPGAEADMLRELSDQYRMEFPENSIAVLASVINGRPIIVASVSKNLNALGVDAGKLADYIARKLGGGGGGKPTLAQAGGRDADKLDQALESVAGWVDDQLG